MPSPRVVAVPSGSPAGRALPYAAGLVLLVVAVYWNSLGAPFQFDDEPAIVYNPTIRSLGTALHPPANGAGVTGRPLVNLTLALNYAIGGLEPRGYHAVNIALHLGAALALAGLLRRTLPRAGLANSEPLAWAVALAWALHPLQTESVTNVVQRAESLVGLCYLVTLYAFIRGTNEREKPETGNRNSERNGGLWLGLSVVACLLGMASKEVMVSAPLVVFLCDRTFVTGSFQAAWAARWRYYLALASTWLLLAWLVAGTAGRGGSAGFATEMSPWRYLLTQGDAIVHYVRLTLWPHPLVLDYGTPLAGSLADVWWQVLLVTAAFGATVWALVRRPIAGFAGVCFFAVLAPSSSFVPVVTQTLAEHRMYLALAVLLSLVTVPAARRFGQSFAYVLLVIAVIWGALTMRRNQDYQDALRLWTQTVAAAPTNPRAHLNLGQILAKADQWPEAESHFVEAVRLGPEYAEAHYNLGLALSRRRELPKAIEHFETALKLAPDYAVAHNDLGIAYADSGRPADAQAQFEAALRERPDFAAAHFNLANLLLRTGRGVEAIPHLESAAGLKPDVTEYHATLGVALMQAGRGAEAVAHYQKAVELTPQSPELQLSLALALAAGGRLREAVAPLEAALRLRPGFAPAQHYLNQVRADLSRLEAKR